MRKLVILGLVVVAALVGYHFFTASMQGGHHGGMGGAMPVSVAVVQSKPVTEYKEFSGRFKAVADAQIQAQVGGTVEKILFNEGDLVKAGQPLFIIDQRTYKAAALSAQAAYAQAKAALERGQSLVTTQAISRRDYESRVAAYQQASAALTNAKLNEEYSQIKAPITGRIGRADITVGNVVTSGPQAPVLTTIQSINPIYVDFNMDEQTYLASLATKAQGTSSTVPVSVALANDGSNFSISGTLKSVDNQLDPATASLRARAQIANSQGTLLPGLFGRVRVGSAQPVEEILVNDAAIGTDQSKRFVYVVGADKKAMYTEVTLGGLVEGNQRVIKSGLKGGEQIVVNGLMRVHPGAEVMPSVVDMQTLSPTTVTGAAPAVSASTPAAK
ncbi:MAG TPA: efflux RND transporter periplasmic adaptor subunit [Alphaproteobacteria bacterium]|nr:efflux RND transporter periplasmic adaptor subunit [Alphaproteobacteria bacterium]